MPASFAGGPTRREVVYAFLTLFLVSVALILLGYTGIGGAEAFLAVVVGVLGLGLSCVVLVAGLWSVRRVSVPGTRLRRRRRGAASSFGRAGRAIWRRLVPVEAPTAIKAALGFLAILTIAGTWVALSVYWLLLLVMAGLMAGFLGPFQSAPS